jgi:hypothetical protein
MHLFQSFPDLKPEKKKSLAWEPAFGDQENIIIRVIAFCSAMQFEIRMEISHLLIKK